MSNSLQTEEQFFSKISPETSERLIGFIQDRDQSLCKWVDKSQSTVLNYLFVLNSGGLAGLLAYSSSKSISLWLKIAIASFIIGTVTIVFHAVWDYYKSEQILVNYRKRKQSYYSSEISFERFWQNDMNHHRGEWKGHVLGWTSGLSCLAGIIIAAFALV